MIKLVFSINREVFRVEIDKKEIFYSDRLWTRSIRLVPKDKEFIKKIILSRNKLPKSFLQQFELTKQEEKEYNSTNSEEELSEICIRDCKKKGAFLISKEVVNGNS